MLRRRRPVVALVAWTGYVWVNRIVNAWNDAEIPTASKVGSTVLAGSVLGLGVAAAVVLVRARARPLSSVESKVVRALCLWTVAVWVVRMAEIAGADYSTRPSITSPTAFKIVHLVLGVVSIVLAGLSWRAVARTSTDRSDLGDGPVATEAGAGSVSPGAESVR